MSTVFLTGATGLLGSHIAGTLLQRGYQVKALYRSMPSLATQLPWYSHIQWVKGDVTRREELRYAAEGCEYIIHAAARTDPYPGNFEAYYSANILGTHHLLDVAQEIGVTRLVYVSTAAVYQPGSLQHPATEASAYAMDLMDSGYIASKYEAQKLVQRAIRNGLPVVTVNPTFMLGPYDFKPSSGALIRYILKNRNVFLPGDGGKNFVDVRDAATATVNALHQGRIGQNYLLANENHTYRTFFERVCQEIGEKRMLIPIPSPWIRAAGKTATLGERLFRQPLRFNYINSVLISQDNYYAGNRARAELHLPRTPLETSIQDTVRWFNDFPQR